MEAILIIVFVLCFLLFVLAAICLVGFSLYKGWFTLPGPGPDRERNKLVQRAK